MRVLTGEMGRRLDLGSAAESASSFTGRVDTLRERERKKEDFGCWRSWVESVVLPASDFEERLVMAATRRRMVEEWIKE